MAFVKKGNVVFSRPSRPSGTSEKRSRQSSPRNVRRRRLIWLIVMITFFVWFFTEFVTQAEPDRRPGSGVEGEKGGAGRPRKGAEALREEIKRLHDEEYLKELARKYGYKEPGRGGLQVPEGTMAKVARSGPPVRTVQAVLNPRACPAFRSDLMGAPRLPPLNRRRRGPRMREGTEHARGRALSGGLPGLRGSRAAAQK